MIWRCALIFWILCLGLLPNSGQAQTQIRIATWNIETVGSAGTTEYEAALDVLGRIGADVVALNEIASAADTANLEQLASEAGYPYLTYSSGAPFGSDRNAVLSRHAFVGPAIEHTSSSLSGDSAANDITRLPLEVVIDVPGNALDLTLVTQHWKSGTGNDDEFRRAIESIRIGQSIADLFSEVDAYVIMGDVNEEADSVPKTPNPVTSLPSGLPGSFSLGSDLALQLAGAGISNDPFQSLRLPTGVNATLVTALQLDGSDATRPSSGRRLDYVLVSEALGSMGVSAEVYDSQDEGLAPGLTLIGSPLAASASTDASDHFPVLVDLVVPARATEVPVSGAAGIGLLILAALGLGAAVAQRATGRTARRARRGLQ
ncbi:MAG: hypothetical protein QF890_02675 [Myxococcota bacterium]|jgi:endonuclease/exonuclease/phosphatase family metal-dependent hydrolase|nr:hypothetical protein [Deltaproteobacteria bacterium]MCP4239585.1 hypothetical protein [bacterium]MDP6075326.1 hypothetical protein [Myxococcota bacterium]MDP7073998.1 hypothetical protein [Myxococcota bacterium]MDP7300260.1 hypothetical protein [Myxococcota bacterium]